jgi:hypothetical protein
MRCAALLCVISVLGAISKARAEERAATDPLPLALIELGAEASVTSVEESRSVRAKAVDLRLLSGGVSVDASRTLTSFGDDFEALISAVWLNAADGTLGDLPDYAQRLDGLNTTGSGIPPTLVKDSPLLSLRAAFGGLVGPAGATVEGLQSDLVGEVIFESIEFAALFREHFAERFDLGL